MYSAKQKEKFNNKTIVKVPFSQILKEESNWSRKKIGCLKIKMRKKKYSQKHWRLLLLAYKQWSNDKIISFSIVYSLPVSKDSGRHYKARAWRFLFDTMA